MKRIALFALALLNAPVFARDEHAMPFWDGLFSALSEAARKQDKPALLYLLSMVAAPAFKWNGMYIATQGCANTEAALLQKIRAAMGKGQKNTRSKKPVSQALRP